MFRARVSQHERALKRAPVGPLHKTLVKPPTYKAYSTALQLFRLWLHFWLIPFPVDGDDLDHRVCEYGEAAWEEGENRATFACLVSGIRFFEESLQPRLGAARRLIAAWDKAEQAVKSFPLTTLMAEAMAAEAFERGWILEASAILIGLAGMFRIMELLNITAKDVSGSIRDEAVIVTLHETKTSSKKQAPQHAFLRDPMAAMLALALKDGLQPGDRLFQALSPKVFRDRLRRLAILLNLGHLLITPHSLRRGGATICFRSGGSLHKVATDGRWDSLKTCRSYVDCAVAELAGHSLLNRDSLQSSAAKLRRLFH